MSDQQTENWQRDKRHHIVPADDERFPELLGQISNPPLLLYVDGNADILHLPAIAIVGSRNPSKGGERNAFEFAQHLAGIGFTIVSGLAQGIDTAAHRGALAAGGRTVAFLGHGIDRVYPASQSRHLPKRSRQAAPWSASFRSVLTHNANSFRNAID